jgi:hypothetical protein
LFRLPLILRVDCDVIVYSSKRGLASRLPMFRLIPCTAL